ncbi:MAG: hypothetical protein KF787_03290 [Phycisphaeraceae bacterium]|nr:hypothetical protein [Phycisphaeraceae bacterium]
MKAASGMGRGAARSRESPRGAVIVIVVMMIGATHLAVMGSVASMADDAHAAALRVETARAFYAADGCVMACRRMIVGGLALPSAGDTVSFERATGTYLDVPPDDGEGELVIEGRSGTALRRVRVMLSY